MLVHCFISDTTCSLAVFTHAFCSGYRQETPWVTAQAVLASGAASLKTSSTSNNGFTNRFGWFLLRVRLMILILMRRSGLCGTTDPSRCPQPTPVRFRFAFKHDVYSSTIYHTDFKTGPNTNGSQVSSAFFCHFFACP